MSLAKQRVIAVPPTISKHNSETINSLLSSKQRSSASKKHELAQQ